MPRGVALAYHGNLLLDELPECTRHGLEVLRQLLENSITPIQSPACPRPCGTGRAGGADADRHGLVRARP